MLLSFPLLLLGAFLFSKWKKSNNKKKKSINEIEKKKMYLKNNSSKLSEEDDDTAKGKLDQSFVNAHEEKRLRNDGEKKSNQLRLVKKDTTKENIDNSLKNLAINNIYKKEDTKELQFNIINNKGINSNNINENKELNNSFLKENIENKSVEQTKENFQKSDNFINNNLELNNKIIKEVDSGENIILLKREIQKMKETINILTKKDEKKETELANIKLGLKSLKIKDEIKFIEINQLKKKSLIYEYAYKILFIRKFSNAILENILNNKKNFALSREQFIDSSKPEFKRKKFSIIIAINTFEDLSVNTINLVLDFLMYLKDVSSSNIHISDKESLYQLDILIDYLKMIEGGGENGIEKKNNEFYITSDQMLNILFENQIKEKF